ncbi:hypothetical protein Dsin_032008 [Dipteronia sinensis]|uniref:Reverse transcriptase domain-containing protein n=1 Tax=Dipteronia sinensis TaxID=43782 RepID=A0AAD9ZMH8_9ROSI|nr:hypothetical protein Dsin_032008 [Dipteronia sinensis]
MENQKLQDEILRLKLVAAQRSAEPELLIQRREFADKVAALQIEISQLHETISAQQHQHSIALAVQKAKLMQQAYDRESALNFTIQRLKDRLARQARHSVSPSLSPQTSDEDFVVTHRPPIVHRTCMSHNDLGHSVFPDESLGLDPSLPSTETLSRSTQIDDNSDEVTFKSRAIPETCMGHEDLGLLPVLTVRKPLSDNLLIAAPPPALKGIFIQTTVHLSKTESFQCTAYIDSGATSSYINRDLVPPNLHSKVSPGAAQQFDGSITIYDTALLDAHISFLDAASDYRFPLPKVWIHSAISDFLFILGLSFLNDRQGSAILLPQHLVVARRSVTIPLLSSDVAQTKRGGIPEATLDTAAVAPIVSSGDLLCTADTDPIISIDDWYPDLQLSSPESSTVTDPKLQRVIDYAHTTLIFGSDPLKHWEKDMLLANINIIKPDLRILTKEFPYTPEDVKEFDIQISELLQQNLISKSTAPHRSAAFMVRNHAEQIRGKARMVINYKRLNDNTYTDAYDIPTKELLMLRISNAKYFSKFDCKSGFWQVKLDSDSIPWTTFSCSKGLFQWNVMPFELKNAPGIFQRKMDGLFNKEPFLDFCLVYIDDILVFSTSKDQHERHLIQVITQFIEHGLVINPKKMVLLQKQIEFL